MPLRAAARQGPPQCLDCNPLYKELDVLVEAGLPQMKLYYEIGKALCLFPAHANHKSPPSGSGSRPKR